MRFAALASGSSGNCFVIEKNKKLILIDAGISCKQTFLKLKNLKLNPKKIDSIFITHEHGDHIRGLDVLKKKTGAEIFMTKGTFVNARTMLNKDQVNFIKNNETIKRGGFEINAFSKNHDAEDPVSFIVHGSNSLAVLTDIGEPCHNVIDAVRGADSIILESNHDEDMLNNGRYPIFLKRRIASDIGHLSNHQASLLALENARNLNNLVLAHLSLNNNTEELAYKNMHLSLKKSKAKPKKLVVSTRFKETKLFKV
jgi:phosphoribosyl 1,2-cyclic phosphodiesterase